MWITSMRKIKQIREGYAELCHTGTFIARAYSTVVFLVFKEGVALDGQTFVR